MNELFIIVHSCLIRGYKLFHILVKAFMLILVYLFLLNLNSWNVFGYLFFVWWFDNIPCVWLCVHHGIDFTRETYPWLNNILVNISLHAFFQKACWRLTVYRHRSPTDIYDIANLWTLLSLQLFSRNFEHP